MQAWVYHSQRRTSEAAAFVQKLRASGEYGAVRPSNARYYAGEVHRGDHVFHDGSCRRLVWAHEEAGVPIELWAEPTLNPEASTEEVRRNGAWFTAYRSGVKVGTSQRTEPEAWAVLRA